VRFSNINPNSPGTNDGKCKKAKKGWKNNRISYIVLCRAFCDKELVVKTLGVIASPNKVRAWQSHPLGFEIASVARP
jgi:hypothetical protein